MIDAVCEGDGKTSTSLNGTNLWTSGKIALYTDSFKEKRRRIYKGSWDNGEEE
jgi:uncharacterized protein YhjY with autotransporter beta-barrel domain